MINDSSMNFTKDFLLTREWIQALLLFVASLVAIAVLKKILAQIRLRPHWMWLSELIPYIINLGYVIALSIFLDASPLDHRAAVWAENVTYVLTVWFLLALVRRTFLLTAEWSTKRAGVSPTLQQGFVPLIRNVATLFVFATGSIMVLKHFGYDVVSLLTALGVGSLAVGLAAKETLSNMISGFVLIMDRNLHPGDRVLFSGSTGDVEVIGLRSTRIRTGDGNTMIVPNSDLVNNRIVNLSDPSRGTTCTTQIRVPFTADFTKVKEIALKILKGIQKVDQNRSAWVNLASVIDGHQLINVGCWVREMDDSGEVLTLFHRELIAALNAERIPMIENFWPGPRHG